MVHDNRTLHADAGSGDERSSTISRWMSANRYLSTAEQKPASGADWLRRSACSPPTSIPATKISRNKFPHLFVRDSAGIFEAAIAETARARALQLSEEQRSSASGGHSFGPPTERAAVDLRVSGHQRTGLSLPIISRRMISGPEQAIMKVDQGEFIAQLRAVIVAQFQDFELADRIVDVARIPRPS
jgi:hypothetical protein